MEELQTLVKLFVDKGESRPKLGPSNNGKLTKLIEVYGKEKFDELVAIYKAEKNPVVLTPQEIPFQPLPIVSAMEAFEKTALEKEIDPRELLITAWGAMRDADDKGKLQQYIASLKSNPDLSIDSVLATSLKIVTDGDSRGAIKKVFRSV